MAEYDNEANGELQEFDTIAASVSAVYLDNRKYYWPNYDPVQVHREKYMFIYSIPVSPSKVINQSGAFYVATFTESLLLTWVGMEANIHRRIGASTYISVNVEGSNPFSDYHKPVFEYCRVREQEPLNIHLMTTDNRIDSQRGSTIGFTRFFH